MPLENGQLIRHDRYRIDALLGKGGMGAVYKAWDTSLELTVAIKENLDLTPEAQKQFNREASILARLSHPNLPRVTDYFLIPDQGQYLVMDYIEGIDLQSMLERLVKLPEPQVLNWISQICDAVAYLHTQPTPIIHRDIKPANIKIRPDGRAVLVDFGIAKLHSASKATTVGAKAVTPGYSPPEQYGDYVHTDARTDIYALGATLYHLLTGKEPPESVLRVVNKDLMPPPRQLNQELDEGIEDVIVRSTELSTERRYQSVDELREALKTITTQLPPEAVSRGASPAGHVPPKTQDEYATQTLTGTDQGTGAIAESVLFAPAGARRRTPEAGLAHASGDVLVQPVGAGRTPPGQAEPVPSEVGSVTPATGKAEVLSAKGRGKGIPIWVWIGAGFVVLCLVLGGGGYLVVRQLAARLEPTATATLAPTQTQLPSTATLTRPPDNPTPTAESVLTPTIAPVVSDLPPSGYEPIASLIVPSDLAVRGVAEKDGFAYVLTRQNRLLVYDIRDLGEATDFVQKSDFLQNIPLKNGNGLFRVGEILYAYGNAGMQMLDISDPANPELKREQVDLMIFGMLVQGDQMIAVGAEKFLVYDISSPLSPRQVGKLSTGADTINYSAVVRQNYLFIAQYVNVNGRIRGYILVYDFTDPKNPRQVQKIDANEIGFHLILHENYLLRCTLNDVEAWELSQADYPRFRFAERGQALACVYDRGNIIASGIALQITPAGWSVLNTFDPFLEPGGIADNRLKGYETIPYSSYSNGAYIFLAQQGRVLVLKAIYE